jgi:hypothetical protein
MTAQSNLHSFWWREGKNTGLETCQFAAAPSSLLATNPFAFPSPQVPVLAALLQGVSERAAPFRLPCFGRELGLILDPPFLHLLPCPNRTPDLFSVRFPAQSEEQAGRSCRCPACCRTPPQHAAAANWEYLSYRPYPHPQPALRHSSLRTLLSRVAQPRQVSRSASLES